LKYNILDTVEKSSQKSDSRHESELGREEEESEGEKAYSEGEGEDTMIEHHNKDEDAIKQFQGYTEVPLSLDTHKSKS